MDNLIKVIIEQLLRHEITKDTCIYLLSNIVESTPDMRNLRQARQARNLTLRQVEESTGISNAYLSQLERGVIKNPSQNIIIKLRDFYFKSPISSK